MKHFTDIPHRGRVLRVVLTAACVLAACAAPAAAAAFGTTLSTASNALSGATSALIWASFAIAAISLQGVRAACHASRERARDAATDTTDIRDETPDAAPRG